MNDLHTIVVVIGDLHCGSTVGLMPPFWQTSDNNIIIQNELQVLLWQQWLENWHIIADLRLNNVTWPRLIIVHNGDAVEGDHHDTTQLITKRIDEQERILGVPASHQ